MTAAGLLARCRELGIELGVASGNALLWEARADPPADLLADLAANKAAVLSLVRGPHGNCPHCGRALDDRRRCWRCCDRLCPCGRPTASAFIELCNPCGLPDHWKTARRAQETTPAPATEATTPSAGPAF
jgi:hypothetical protein